MKCIDCGHTEFGQFPDPNNPKVAMAYCKSCGEVQ